MTTPDAGRASGDDRRLLETLQRVLAIQELDLRGALTQACNQIAEALRMVPAGVTHHLGRLEAAGLVIRKRRGRHVVVERTARGTALRGLYAED